MERVGESPAGGVARPTAPRALCLAGPTASGKSAIALAFARAHAARQPVELVAVDSAQVYRGLDIGSAKPDADERASVPHHLVDIADPAEPYSAARFVADANEAIAAIRARGHLPLLVGGTMLYLRALRIGLDALPEADPALRRRLDAEAARAGWPALHAELARVDPQTAARLAPQDAQRIQRALEVWHLTGRPLSALHRGARPAAADLPLVALEPERRDWLHSRIAQRFDAMLAAGFIDEVRALRARADLHGGLPALRSVGYRQAWAALDAADPPDLAALREAAIAATRQLAKRQLTWLRSMPERHVVAADAPDAPALALARLAALARGAPAPAG